MANSQDSEKFMRNMSIIAEEEDGSEYLNKNGGEVISTLNVNDKLKLPLTDVEPTKINSNERGNNRISLPLNEMGTEGVAKVSPTKNVTFFDDSKWIDSHREETTPMPLSVGTPVRDTDILDISTQNKKDTSEDSAVSIATLAGSNTQDSSYQDTNSSSPHPSNHLLPSPTATEELSSAPDIALQGENTGRRHFEVSNVDEATLRSEIENEIKKKDLNNTEESGLDNRPLLEKTSSSYSDSDQSTYNANFDTIGPLENPRFLMMLNYSASRTVQDDGLKGTSNLDLANFTGSQPPTDTDSGWAWVVLFAAFFSLSLTGATAFAGGVLMPSFLEKIDPDMTKASWIGAVHISVLCMSGPFVGAVLTRLGAKRTAFCAGITLSSGLIAAAFASSILGLIFTHGLMAGIGSGFILNTMYVTVGQYFNRYRGLACGLLATGSGLGMLAGGNALTAIVNFYGLRGTYLLWAGVTLHSLVFAMLLRPSPAEQRRKAERKAEKEAKERAKRSSSKRRRIQDFRGDVGSIRSGTNSIFRGRTNSFKRSQKSVNRTSQSDLGVAPLLKSVLHRDMSRSTYSVATNRSVKRSNLNVSTGQTVPQNKLTSEPGVRPKSLNIPSSPNSGTSPATQSPTSSSINTQYQARQSSSSEKFKFPTPENIPLIGSNSISEVPELSATDSSSPNVAPSPTFSRTPLEFKRPLRKRLTSGSSQAPSQYTSVSRLSYRPSIREQLTRNDLDNESLASTLVSHLQPQDALSPRYRLGSRSVSSMFGSIASFPTALVMIKDDLSQLDATDGSMKKTTGDYFVSFLDSLRLLRNKPFLVFITTCMLWALADSPFSMYLPAYTKSKGSSLVEASSLYTSIGFGSMCGRFLSGLVASDSGIGPVLLHVGCLCIASLVVFFSPWITSTYLEQMICAGLFGLYTGSLVPLSSLITIELLGIGELGLGFGFLSLAQGIGYLAGPPLLGMVIKTVGYEMGFRIAGIILFCGSLLDMIIALLIRKVDDESLHDSFDDLERALGRISDNESDDDDDIISYQDKQQSPTSTTSETALKDNEGKSRLVQETAIGAGVVEEKEKPKLTPTSEVRPATANDLLVISEEN